MQTLFLKTLSESIKHWYIPLLAGLFFVAVSVITFTSPAGSLLALAILFSLSFLFSGVSEIVFAIANWQQLENRVWTLVFGIITAVVGILLLASPSLSLTALAFYIGFTLLFRSVAAISFSLDVKKYGGKGWGGLLFFGILGTFFSFILIWNPVFAGMSMLIWISLSFLFVGLFSIFLSFQMRKLHKSSKKLSAKLRERFHELSEDIREEWSD